MKTRPVIARLRRLLGSPTAAPAPAVPEATDADKVEMLGRLGVALLQSSRASSVVERTLQEIAREYGWPIRSFVLPTLILVEEAVAGAPGTKIFPAVGDGLRLDQAGEIERLIERASADRTPPAQVVAELDRIRASRPRFGPATRILGHVILTVGFGLLLNPVPAAVGVYAVLGAVVGVVVVFGSLLSQLRLVLPVLVPFGLTILSTTVLAPWIGQDPIQLVAPALVSFLPGLALTLAAVELASSQMVAGASRMVYASAQLGLLVFGVFAAITIVGVHPSAVHPPQLGWWAPWAGVVLTALGYTLFSVAPRGAFLWILAALAIAYGAQLVGAILTGAQLSGFFGAVVVIPLVRLMRRLPGAPPAAVMLMCAYWLLVPGALGFIGVSQALEGDGSALTILGQTLVSIAAIALGMVVGVSLGRESDVLVGRMDRDRRRRAGAGDGARAGRPGLR